jgi:hypothetical protein
MCVNLAYTFSGSVDDIIAATGSVDQTGNYVFAVEPHGVGRHGGVSSVYWAYGGGFDTMYTFWNPLSVAQQMQLIVVADSGVTIYAMPIRLAPGGSQTVDLFELFSMGAADPAGRVMPRGPMQGSAILTGPKNDTTDRLTVVIAGGIYNSKTATCGETCETCDGFTSVSVSPDPTGIEVSGTAQMTAQYTWYTGYQYNSTSTAQWSSNATGVATIQTTGQSSPGLAAALSVGSVQFQAFYGEMPPNAGQICDEGSLPPCPDDDVYASAPAAVTPEITFNGKNVTNGTSNVIVGQQINLSVSAGGTISKATWTVPGTITGGYTASTSSGSTAAANLGIVSPTFYWVDAASSRTVSVSVILSDGSTGSASTTFNVVAPTGSMAVQPEPGVGVTLDSNCNKTLEVHYGCPTGVGGIFFSNNYSTPLRLFRKLSVGADRQLEHQPNPDVWHGAKLGPARRRAALRGVRHHLSVQYQHAGGERQPWHRSPSRLPGEDEERQFYDDPDVPAQWCRFRDLRADLVRWVVVGLRCDV